MILEALNAAYERVAREKLANGRPRVPAYGYSYERIGFALVLDWSGKLLDVTAVDTGDLAVPSDATITRTCRIQPMFLWDKTAYALGLTRQTKQRTSEEHESFKRRQREVIASSTDAGLRALLGFLDGWVPSAKALPRHRQEIIGTNVVFRLDGDGYLHERPAAREVWLRHLQGKPAQRGTCLVKGEPAPIALTHPTLRGVRGAQPSGAALVSFNRGAFTSFGKEQGANAPVSEYAAYSYTTTLNDLLRKDRRQKIHIGATTTVYWAEAADSGSATAPEEVRAAERAFSLLSEPWRLDHLGRSETTLAAEVMALVRNGKPLDAPELHLKADTKLYILGLAPNVARLSVRFWEATTLGSIGRSFHQHWRDLYMEPHQGRELSLASYALATARPRDNKQGQVEFSFDDIPPALSGELMRAVLAGSRYPATLLATLVMRIRSDRHINRRRVSLIKAAIVRSWRIDGKLPTEEYLVRSDPGDSSPARRLGRLFALIERAQHAALGRNIFATIKDTCIGRAAATPALVFPPLVKNANCHLAQLRRGDSGAGWIRTSDAPALTARRHGAALERDIGELWAAFHNRLPPQLSIVDQGLFFVGYYQESFAGKKKSGAVAPNEAPAQTDDAHGDCTLERD